VSPAARLRETANANATPISNAVIVLAIIASLSFLVYVGKVNGDAYISIASVVVGALLHRQGVVAGSKATSDPPPA
jgi:hypothetical protein